LLTPLLYDFGDYMGLDPYADAAAKAWHVVLGDSRKASMYDTSGRVSAIYESAVAKTLYKDPAFLGQKQHDAATTTTAIEMVRPVAAFEEDHGLQDFLDRAWERRLSHIQAPRMVARTLEHGANTLGNLDSYWNLCGAELWYLAAFEMRCSLYAGSRFF
jgi:hypothetical protein